MADGNLGEKRHLDLGWIAGTTIQPSKRREIEGISAASIMDLQAQLYQAQEQRREGAAEAGHVKGRRGGLEVKGFKGVMERRNTGVEGRHKQDMTHYKTDSQQISETYAALERKAQLYDKLARGELQDDDGQQYEVDFLSKGEWRNSQPRHASSHAADGDQPHDTCDRGGASSAGDAGMRRPHLQGSGDEGGSGMTHEELQEAERRQQHKEVVMQLAAQTREQRQRAAEVKREKERLAASKVERLKEEFLKKQLKRTGAGKAKPAE